MAMEQPVGKTLSSMGLPANVLEDIRWHNCFRFLNVETPVL
jgi:hypothetical protein